jgi:hypothetical protein
MGRSKMSWFRRRKRRIETRIIDIPLPILTRQNVYDSIFDDVEKIANKMGLPPISEEVSDMEKEASYRRIARFAPLLPFIDAQADISARVSATAYLITLGLEDEDRSMLERELDEVISLFKLVSVSAAVSCISTLINLELLSTDVVSKDEEVLEDSAGLYMEDTE